MGRKYFYLHRNGKLIEKDAYVVEKEGVQSYFDSPNVIKYWTCSTEEDIEFMNNNVKEIRLRIESAIVNHQVTKP